MKERKEKAEEFGRKCEKKEQTAGSRAEKEGSQGRNVGKRAEIMEDRGEKREPVKIKEEG